MSNRSGWRNHFQEHKIVFTAVIIGLLLFELQIFAFAAMKSGGQVRIQVMDQQNQVVYETVYADFDDHEKIRFENNFGPLTDFTVRQVRVQRPFPFRAWFAAAIGLPIGAMLLFAFFVRAYEALFFKDDGSGLEAADDREGATDRIGLMVSRISRLNIFVLGSFVLLLVIGMYAVPYFVADLGRHGASVVSEYRWVFIAIFAVILGLVIWFIFLRYRLAQRTIDAQMEVEKYRLQLECRFRQGSRIAGPDQQLRLPDRSTSEEPPFDGRRIP
ncbi:hypothetical protein [Desulfatitalea alkaliphila]|uniref:Uncharacterized protein n=1 Tax=Desulfatitalea alkaliphila TaxID=2929485 RepID=A0AA41UI52_9BACT|nr:hypothetical protein [Desulfatitalea alkaliphila]MCJ8500385.1 hypothetical protein [Desulfatitalea alkaliphila]